MTEADEELTRARARIGTTLRGKYKLDAVLGVGGMAVVYAATHRNRKRFAVKMLHPELSGRQDVRERFVREGYVANTIEHPNALAVLDDDIADDGAAFVVMELLKGLTVDELWESCGHKLAPQAVLAIAHGLLDVLAAAHHKSIVHRDIKPANVFILADGTVKVLDFGIARLRDAASKSSTSTGMMLGTPAFLPPEQALAKSSDIDNRTDIWAVGATMFTLLSGMLVHEGDNGPQLVVHTATRPARSLASVAPDVPAAIVSIVDKALAFEKANRWETADLMRDAIASTYATSFGEPLSRASIAALMASRQERQATADAPNIPSANAGASPVSPTVDDMAHQTTLAAPPRAPDLDEPREMTARMQPSAPAMLARPGGTTAQPVTGASPMSTQRGASRLMWILPVGGVVLAAAVVGIVTAFKAPHNEKGQQTTGALISSAVSSAAVTPVVPPADLMPLATSVPEHVASVVRPTPHTVYQGAAPGPIPPRAARDSGAAAPAPSVDCSIPKYIDSTGRERWRPECVH